MLFLSTKLENGVKISGSALYEPDLSSYRDDGRIQRLVYYNKYERELHHTRERTEGAEGAFPHTRDWWLEISFNKETRAYRGTKYCREEAIVMAGDAHPWVDSNWHRFFINLTKRGLSNGEGCKFTRN